MPETPETETPRFPARDDDGRVVSLPEMIAYSLFTVVLGGVLLAIVDGLFWIFGSTFGQISGWIGGIIAVFAFVDDFRAWRTVRVRWVVAPVGVVLGVVGGFGLLALLPGTWPPLITGLIGIALASVVYSVLWFAGVRLLSGER